MSPDSALSWIRIRGNWHLVRATPGFPMAASITRRVGGPEPYWVAKYTRQDGGDEAHAFRTVTAAKMWVKEQRQKGNER